MRVYRHRCRNVPNTITPEALGGRAPDLITRASTISGVPTGGAVPGELESQEVGREGEITDVCVRNNMT